MTPFSPEGAVKSQMGLRAGAEGALAVSLCQQNGAGSEQGSARWQLETMYEGVAIER